MFLAHFTALCAMRQMGDGGYRFPPGPLGSGLGLRGLRGSNRPVVGEGTSSDREVELIAIGGARRCRACFVSGLAEHDKHVSVFEGFFVKRGLYGSVFVGVGRPHESGS